MRVLVLYNPVSGSGKSAAAAHEALEALGKAGHEATLLATRLENCQEWLDPCLVGGCADLLVVAGGDGAIRMAAEATSRADVPMYHLPCGTENLFAREFNMKRNIDQLLRAISANDVRTMDLGFANEQPFLLMVSVGYDAEVVHDLSQRRGKSISHWTYLMPVLRQLWKWHPRQLKVEVDGQRVDRDRTGFVVVANCKQYGWRLNPAAMACMNDGVLDVAFFPTRGRAQLLQWVIRCRRGRQMFSSDFIHQTGARITIRSDQPFRYQLDGDPPRDGQDGECELRVTVRPGAVKVLVPEASQTNSI